MKQDIPIVGLAQGLNFQYFLAAAVCIKVDFDFVAYQDGLIDGLPFDALDTFERIFCFGREFIVHLGPSLILSPDSFQAFDFVLLQCVQFVLLLKTQLAFLEVITVVACIGRDFAILQFKNFLDCPVEQLAIMRNDEYGSWIARYVLLQPGFSFEIKVVIWLVEQ